MSLIEAGEEAIRDMLANAPPEAQENITTAVRQVAQDAQVRFIESVGRVVKGGKTRAARIQPIVEKGLRMKALAVMAKTPEEARNYAAGYDSCVRALKISALGQAVVTSDEAAAWLMESFKTAGDMLGSAVLSIFGALVQGAVKGAVAGLIGGEGGGSSSLGGSLFPR